MSTNIHGHPVDGVKIEAVPWTAVIDAHKAAEAVEGARIAVGEFYLAKPIEGSEVLQLGADSDEQKQDVSSPTICR